MMRAFHRGRTNLVYAETKMNKLSSRSHAVFQARATAPRTAKPSLRGKRRGRPERRERAAS